MAQVMLVLRSQAEAEGGLRRIAKAAAYELMGLGNEVTPSLLAEGHQQERAPPSGDSFLKNQPSQILEDVHVEAMLLMLVKMTDMKMNRGGHGLGCLTAGTLCL